MNLEKTSIDAQRQTNPFSCVKSIVDEYFLYLPKENKNKDEEFSLGVR